MEVRPIVPNKLYCTCQQSQFLHCLLEPAVFRNEHVLKDALTLIRRIDSMQPGPNLRVTTFDVTALYPSIDLERGLNSLRWFLNTFCSEYQDTDLKDLIVLTHCFITCPEISSNPFHQLNGTAMGTTFAVVYANIHMIFIKWTIVYNYKQCLDLYNCFLDDGICFWIGSDTEFKAFSDELGAVDPSIRLIWSFTSGHLLVVISLFRLLTRFFMRPTVSPVMLLHFFLWAPFTYERLSQSLSKPYFILR
jgi:hypothetical protein